MPTKFQLITELYDQTVQSVTGSYQSWTGFLRAACYNYKCPFDDQILIYAQRPDATAVLEMERWNKRFGRWVNRGAKSIAVFGDDGQNCLKLYFDVSDTHASRFARPLPIWTMHPAFEPEVIETLEATFGNLAEKENLADAVRSACHNAVADNFTDYLQDLRECREDSLLEELDDLNLEVFYRDALEVSVAYMLMTRLGLRADDYFSPDEFAHVYEFNTPPTINALGIATSDIAEMGLREISRTVMQAQRDQFFANREKSRYDDHTEQHETGRERSKQYGDHLQDAERLSGAEPADAADAGGASGQVHGAAESVPEEAPQSALYQPENQRQADGASGGDRADRAEDGGADRGADGTERGRDGGTESDQSPALDGPDEQSPAQRGGAGAQRPDLRLTTEEPTEAGSDELPAFVDHSGDYVLLDRLRADCDYFLGAGGRSEKHLWAGSVYAQIKKMRELYDALPEKPEWLTTEAIDRYAAQMAAPYQVAAYQLVESKQKFISQIMTSKSPVRSAEDVDEQALSYAEIKALASGNPMIKEKMDLDIEVSKLKLLKSNHLSQRYALEDAISKTFPKNIAEAQERISGYEADIAAVKENTHPNADGFSPLVLMGVPHTDKKEAGAALLTMCQAMLSPEATQIGSYRGLTLELAFDTFAREYRLTMIGQLRHTVTLGTDVFGNLQRMDNALEGLPIKEQACREQLSNLQTQLETAKAEVQKPFPREAELNTKTARLEELNSLLNLDHKEPEIVDAEPDEDQRPPERRRPQMER